MSEASRSPIPLVDIRAFIDGERAGARKVVEAVDRACREIGFLMVTGHQMPADLIRETHRVTRQFFSLPIDEKLRYRVTPERYRGYVPCASEGLAYSLDSETPPTCAKAW